MAPAVTTLEQATSTQASLLGLSWPHLDDAELLRKWFGGGLPMARSDSVIQGVIFCYPNKEDALHVGGQEHAGWPI